MYERRWRNAKLLGDLHKIGFMRLEESQQCGEDGGFGDSLTKLICADSGQVDEPLGASSVTKRCCQCGKRDSVWIDWRIRKQRLHSAAN